MKEAGVDFISTCMDLNGDEDPRPGAQPPGHGRRGAVPPEHLQPAVRGRGGRSLRRRLRVGAVPTLRGRRRGHRARGLPGVDGGDRRRADGAVDGGLDQRHPRLRRPPRRGPGVRPGQGDRRHQLDHRLHRRWADRDRSTGPRPTRPSPTTPARTTTTRSSAPLRCGSWTAPSRPWPRPTSRGCASRLASSGRSPSPPTSADRDT